MPENVRRRAVLGGVAGGLATLAGCAGIEMSVPGGSGSSGSGTAGSGEGTPTGPGESSNAWGTNIPTYPYRETDGPPYPARPDPDVLNPVLTSGHVTDADANYVADPFLFVENGAWHMFFEVYNSKGLIGHATGTESGTVWSYDRIVLERPFHVSFPQVFKWRGEYYMTTEDDTAVVRLYRATDFPTEWEEVDLLYNSTHYGDPSVSDQALFRWNDRWWSIAGGNRGNTYLYYGDSLTGGNWQAHANNPVVKDRPKAARPGGRPIVRDGNVLVFYQQVEPYYGRAVRAYRITDLTPNSFADREVDASPVLRPTGQAGDWNSNRMHHFDPWSLGEGNGWRIAVDGDSSGNDWAIGIYRA